MAPACTFNEIVQSLNGRPNAQFSKALSDSKRAQRDTEALLRVQRCLLSLQEQRRKRTVGVDMTSSDLEWYTRLMQGMITLESKCANDSSELRCRVGKFLKNQVHRGSSPAWYRKVCKGILTVLMSDPRLIPSESRVEHGSYFL